MTREKLYPVNLTESELDDLRRAVGIIYWKIGIELERVTKELDEFTPEKFVSEYPDALITPEERLKCIEESVEERTIDFNNVEPLYLKFYAAYGTIENKSEIKKFERTLSHIEFIADLRREDNAD